MAPRKGRSPVAANVTQQSLEKATAVLAELPTKPKTNYSLREAIHELQGTISAALERGYSHQDVAEMLGENGIRISPASLKSYLAVSNREATGTPKKRRASRKKAEQEAPHSMTPAPKIQEESTPEPAPKKTRGPRTASKAKTGAPAQSQKAASTGTGTRRKRSGAAS